MNLLLISHTAIIKQIFNLVSKKLDIDFTTTDINIANKKFDIIIIEDELFNDQFPIRNYAKQLGIISKDKISHQKKCDFILSKPFLPSTLVTILEEQIKYLNTDNNIQEKETYEKTTETADAVNFIETLVEDISDEIIEESDESVVEAAFMRDGGILDTKELSKIQNILDDNSVAEEFITPAEENTIEDDDWLDLSNIIDEAIDEVREYQFNKDIPIKLILNEYSMQELSPLLTKLDQKIVDALTDGEEIILQLKVEK